MNFPTQWRQWIRSCVISYSSSIFNNGFPTTPFKLQRRFRQSDPLSLFLFVLIVESPNLLLQKAFSSNFGKIWRSVKGV